MLFLGDTYFDIDGVSVFGDSDPTTNTFYYLPTRVSLAEQTGG